MKIHSKPFFLNQNASQAWQSTSRRIYFECNLYIHKCSKLNIHRKVQFMFISNEKIYCYQSLIIYIVCVTCFKMTIVN